jgi:hypothetical protein
MTKAQMLKRIAYLESINDHLETEVSNMDRLMRFVGFKHGLKTVKAAAEEIISKGLQETNQ